MPLFCSCAFLWLTSGDTPRETETWSHQVFRHHSWLPPEVCPRACPTSPTASSTRMISTATYTHEVTPPFIHWHALRSGCCPHSSSPRACPRCRHLPPIMALGCFLLDHCDAAASLPHLDSHWLLLQGFPPHVAGGPSNPPHLRKEP